MFGRLAGFLTSTLFRPVLYRWNFCTHFGDILAHRGSPSLRQAHIAASFARLAVMAGSSAAQATFGFPPKALFMSRRFWCSTTLRRMVTARRRVSLERCLIVPSRERPLIESGCGGFQPGGLNI
jgi:hypothetical protein